MLTQLIAQATTEYGGLHPIFFWMLVILGILGIVWLIRRI